MLLWYEVESEVNKTDNIIGTFSKNKSACLTMANKYEIVNVDNCKFGDTLYIKPLFNFSFKYIFFKISEDECGDKIIIVQKKCKSIFYTKEYKIIGTSMPFLLIEDIHNKHQKWINTEKLNKRLSFKSREIPNSGIKLNFSLLTAQYGLQNEIKRGEINGR